MDHFHILDAYRSNFKLVPVDKTLGGGASEERRFEDVLKAAHQTQHKYDELRRRETYQTIALASVETMVSVVGLVFLVSIAASSAPRSIKISYSLITVFLFVVAGIFLYLTLFAKRRFNAARSRMTMAEIYRFDDGAARKGYGLAKKIKRLRDELRATDADACADDDPESAELNESIAEFRALLSLSAGEGAEAPVSADNTCRPGFLEDAIRHGMLYTMTDEAGRTIDATVAGLRGILGSETYRVLEETDAADLIDDVIAPSMLRHRQKITLRRQGQAPGAAVTGEQCEGYCGETVGRLVEDTLSPARTTPAALLAEAWERCRPDMEAVCESDRLRTGENKCAFGCAKAEERPPQYSVIRVDNAVPDRNWALKEDLGEGEDEEGGEAAPGAEALCMKAALDDPDVDAAYFGPTEAGGANVCYLHHTAGELAGGRGTMRRVEGEPFQGKVLYKTDPNVQIPGASPAEIAREIAEELEAVDSSFDITDYDVRLYERLRIIDPDFGENRGFYEDVFDGLVGALRGPGERGSADLLVPSIDSVNQALSEMTARDFRRDVVWQVARTSMFLHVRNVRIDQGVAYQPSSSEGHLRGKHGLVLINFVMAVVSSVLSYFVFVVDRESARSSTGTIKLRTLIFGMWHRHLVALSVLVMFWAIVGSWITRANAREIFNDAMRTRNTVHFIERVQELRTFLFGLTGTLPALEGDDDTSRRSAAREPLLAAVHADNIDVVCSFRSPDTSVLDTLTLTQKLRFVTLSQEVVKAYDLCNSVDSGRNVPFPMPEVVVYASSIVILLMGMSYMYNRFNMAEVVRRVERVRELRPRVYMGDADAVREIGGLLECSENTLETRVSLMQNVFVGMIGVTGIIITVMLVNSNDEYVAALNSGFMIERRRCVT